MASLIIKPSMPNSAYTTGELEEIRARVRAFGPAE
jgi:hypothetical protein